MKFTLTEQIKNVTQEPVVGNVYPVRGGTGAKKGYMQIVVAMTETGCILLTIDSDGNVVSGSSYGRHYIAEKTPIAFCPGIEELSFEVRSI
jgi:hypothetical protein